MTAEDYPKKSIETRFLFRITIETNKPDGFLRTVKDTGWGDVLDISVVGGKVEGPAVTGDVLNMGGDWCIASPDGTKTVDCRLFIKTKDEAPAIIQMSYTGFSYDDDGGGYFRTVPSFRTEHPDYAFLNRIVAVASGTHRPAAGPIYDVYQVI